MQRPGTTTSHRELFRAAIIQETVAIACTCGRGVDHWYAEPINGFGHGTAGEHTSGAVHRLSPRTGA
jgi:hypothetical protein